jgi:hypothetical protein
LTDRSNRLNVNWDFFSLSGCVLDIREDLLGWGELGLRSLQCSNMVKASCYEFFIGFWCFNYGHNVVVVFWVVDVIVPGIRKIA